MSELSLTILKECLEKKNKILDDILRISSRQNDILTAQSVDFEAFDECFNEKSVLIEQLSKLDEGFETLYERVKTELEMNKASYATQIGQMQQLIKDIVEKSTVIQATEARNKQTVEAFFKAERQGLNQGKKTMQVALNYYKNMNNSQVVPPQFMDQKK